MQTSSRIDYVASTPFGHAVNCQSALLDGGECLGDTIDAETNSTPIDGLAKAIRENVLLREIAEERMIPP